MISADSVGRVEEGEPIGPSAADEADTGATPEITAVAGRARPAAPAGKLPPLDSLLARLPVETRQSIDEHLRARFVRVRRLQPGELR